MPVILTSTTQSADQMRAEIEAMGYDPSEVEIDGNSATVTPAEEHDPPAPAATEKVVDEGKTADGSDPSKSGEKNPDLEEPETPKGLLKRIDKLTARSKTSETANAELKLANAELKARLDKLDEKATPAAVAEPEVKAERPVAPKRPLLNDFPEYSDFEAASLVFDAASDTYHEALADWKVEQRLAEARKETQTQNAVQDAAAERQNAWVAAVDKAREDLPDFDEVAEGLVQGGTDPTMTQAMADAIVESDVGPYVAHYLATHLDEAKRISKATTYDPAKADARTVLRINRVVAREIRDIEIALASAEPPVAAVAQPKPAAVPPPTPKPKSSQAPPPIKPGGTRSVAAPGIEPEMDFKDYQRVRSEQLAQLRKRAA